eukprot:2735729-Prymnesium_polylepis.1
MTPSSTGHALRYTCVPPAFMSTPSPPRHGRLRSPARVIRLITIRTRGTYGVRHCPSGRRQRTAPTATRPDAAIVRSTDTDT